jgi:hypothetical protein
VQEEIMCSMVSPSVPQILHLSMIDCKPHNYVFFIISCIYNTIFLVFITRSIIMLFHSLGLVYKSMRGVMTNSIDRDQWLNVTSESRDRI